MANSIADAPARATKAPARAQEAPAPAPAAQQIRSGMSESLIVLSLRPEGSKFNGDRIERAQEAGFGWLNKVHMIGMSDPDTGGEIARHVVHGGHEAFGLLKEIQIHIDPESCAWMWLAGKVLMDRLAKYAVLIGASVCDGMGQPLTDEAMLTISDHIDAVMERRRNEDQLARTVTLPNGEQRELSELSFAYEVTREAGSKKRTYRRVRFDVPSLHYYSGRAQGMRMASEVVDFFRAHRTAKLPLTEIIRQALERCENRHGNMQKAEASNVVSGFMEVIETLIAVGSRQLNPAWLTAQINRNEELQVTWSEREAKRKAALAARLRAGREAAKARRLAQGKAGAA